MSRYHEFLHWIVHQLGHHLGESSPEWLHPIFHIVLIWAPLALIIVLSVWFIRVVRQRFEKKQQTRSPSDLIDIPGLPLGVVGFVLKYSPRQQLVLVILGLLSMPVLYATLELPKRIINNAIDSGHFPIVALGHSITQVEFLAGLTGLYFTAILLSGTVKYTINVYKGSVGETLLRRLRLTVYRLWRSGAGSPSRSEVIPIIAQEVEPIGGYASDAVALPVFQGGTFLTIIFFMFMQDPVLGAAALTLLPVQMAIIPRLQKKINALSRTRVREVRSLSGQLGDQATSSERGTSTIKSVGGSIKTIKEIRLKIHRSKYFMKGLNNFLTSLTPVFFYMIGGYLVIEGKLTIGALVAVLAAYKDFSAPLRELFRYYQTFEDVRIRYDEVRKFLVIRTVSAQDTATVHQYPYANEEPAGSDDLAPAVPIQNNA